MKKIIRIHMERALFYCVYNERHSHIHNTDLGRIACEECAVATQVNSLTTRHMTERADRE